MSQDQGGARVHDEMLLPDNDLQVPLVTTTPGERREEEKLCVWTEVKELTVLSVPVALATLARVAVISTDTHFVGQLENSATMASAASLANTWNQFLSNILFAPGYALNSLCSQAIGAKNYKLAGVWLQLALAITLLCCIPVLACYLLTGPVVKALMKAGNEEGDPDWVSSLAQDFNNVSMLILLPMVAYMCIRQYFQAMQIVTPAMIVSGLTVAFNYWMNWMFVSEDGPFEWGLNGSPFATFLSMIFQIGSFLFWTVFLKGYHKPYWGGWSMDCFEKTRLKRFFAIATPMAFGIVLENSGLQLITLATAGIGEAEVAANAALGQVWGLLWAFYWGVGLALQVRVGTKLGQGSANGAKLVARISIGLVLVCCTLAAIIAMAFRAQIAAFFISGKEASGARAQEIIKESMYALVIDYFTACMALCAVNLLEAMAQNRVLAYTLSIGMWAVQVPCSLLFAFHMPAFKEHPVAGIWMGQVCGEVFKMVVLWMYIYRLDWQQMCDEAKQRSEGGDDHGEGDEQDARLESRLEEEDECFAEEVRDINTSHDVDAAEALLTTLAHSPSPFVGSRSPKFVRNIN